MGKEFTLPWTCEQSETFRLLVLLFVCISAPISLGMFAYECYTNTIHLDIWSIMLLIYGLFGSLIGWLTIWMYTNILPTFKCRSKEVNN